MANNTLHDLYYLISVQENLHSLCRRLQDDYSGEKPFEQSEEDRIAVYDVIDTLDEIITKDEFLSADAYDIYLKEFNKENGEPVCLAEFRDNEWRNPEIRAEYLHKLAMTDLKKTLTYM